MKHKFLILLNLNCFLFFCVTEPAVGMPLSQDQVIALVLKQGLKTKEIQFQFAQNQLAEVLALSSFDWKLNLESGFEYDRSRAWSPFVAANSKYERIRTTLGLQKQLTSGTLLGFEINRLSFKSEVGPSASTTATSTIPTQASQESYGLLLEQSLWGNAFGESDRAIVSAARKNTLASDMTQIDELEKIVLETLRQFWESSVAAKTYTQAVAARGRYQRLLDSARRKTKLGFANPGELSLAQAEVELRDQTVSNAKTEALLKQENLVTALNLKPGTMLEFLLPPLASQPTQSSAPAISQIRLLQAQKLKAEASEDLLAAARSRNAPSLSFVAKSYLSGADETDSNSFNAAMSGVNPKYYVGMKFSHSFGSDLRQEEIRNKQAMADLEKSKLSRLTLENADLLNQALRKVQSTSEIAQSAARLNEFRKAIVQELTVSYGQGRVDLRALIEAMNNELSAEVILTRTIGDAQMAQLELAALKDELIH
ncbi:MAG: TolC family protein [Bdellovibrionaceae bacterium]|nr:TolC family protein [Pseudobdellovibrionaceae bacterium]